MFSRHLCLLLRKVLKQNRKDKQTKLHSCLCPFFGVNITYADAYNSAIELPLCKMLQCQCIFNNPLQQPRTYSHSHMVLFLSFPGSKALQATRNTWKWHPNKHPADSLLYWQYCRWVKQASPLLSLVGPLSHWLLHTNTHTRFNKHCILKKADLLNTSCCPTATAVAMQGFYIKQSYELTCAKSQAESLCNRSPVALPLPESSSLQ